MVSSYSADVISHSSSLSYWHSSAIHGFTLRNQSEPPKESHIQDRTPKYYRNAFVGMFVKQSQKPLLPLLCLNPSTHPHGKNECSYNFTTHYLSLQCVQEQLYIYVFTISVYHLQVLKADGPRQGGAAVCA